MAFGGARQGSAMQIARQMSDNSDDSEPNTPTTPMAALDGNEEEGSDTFDKGQRVPEPANAFMKKRQLRNSVIHHLGSMGVGNAMLRQAEESSVMAETGTWAYFWHHLYEIVAFTWAVKQLAYVDRDQLYDRLNSYYGNLAFVTALLLAISSELYYEGQTAFISWDNAGSPLIWNRENFSALILCACLLQLLVIFGCIFLLAGLATIPHWKARKFFEAVKTQATILEGAWAFAIISFLAATLFFIVGANGLTFAVLCGFVEFLLLVGMYKGLSSMVHRLRTHVWNSDDELTDFTVEELLSMLEMYVNTAINACRKAAEARSEKKWNGEVHLQIDEFQVYCLVVAQREKEKADMHWLATKGVSLNNMTRERINRLWFMLQNRIFDYEFQRAESSSKNLIEQGVAKLAQKVISLRESKPMRIKEITSS